LSLALLYLLCIFRPGERAILTGRVSGLRLFVMANTAAVGSSPYKTDVATHTIELSNNEKKVASSSCQLGH
jgi:hypothetical protein